MKITIYILVYFNNAKKYVFKIEPYKRRNEKMNTTWNNIKRKIAIFAVLCMMFTLIPVNAFALSASDISDHWAKTTIQSWMDKGLIKGYPDGTFKPNQNITRAEFITLVNGAFGYTETSPVSYTDVNQNAWYASAVAIAVKAGYFSGYPDGTMKPDYPISREEVATIIMRISKLESNPVAANTYTDAALLNWSKGAVGAVLAANIMRGYPDGSFGPQMLIERGEATVSLDREMKYVAEVTPPPYPAVTADDDQNLVLGMVPTMEYKLDSGTWTAFSSDVFSNLDLSGNRTLLVRYAATALNTFGPTATLTFTN
jgi:hypothetical protein